MPDKNPTPDYSGLINDLVKTTGNVFKDSIFPGGAIVAANSFQSYFPKQAKNYKFVWPRDGSFICYASEIIDMNISDNFFNWCMKAEGWEQKGLYYEKYFISGKQAESNFQPDQTGTLLWAFCNIVNHDETRLRKFERLIVKSANGLCNIWNKDHFTMISQDLWEERLCFPDMKENFTYSLAACYTGLVCAYSILKKERWLETAEQIKEILNSSINNVPGRSFGLHTDNRIDASLLGLIWPFDIALPEKVQLNLIKEIEKKLVRDYGVYRYEHDEYDGWMYNKNIHRRKGAGYWPLLNFWMSIACLQNGKRNEAEKYFFKVLDDIKNQFIPEQVFNNNYQVAVSPLCWSHAMFIIAAQKLGLI